jgi:hypothetical protein
MLKCLKLKWIPESLLLKIKRIFFVFKTKIFVI